MVYNKFNVLSKVYEKKIKKFLPTIVKTKNPAFAGRVFKKIKIKLIP